MLAGADWEMVELEEPLVSLITAFSSRGGVGGGPSIDPALFICMPMLAGADWGRVGLIDDGTVVAGLLIDDGNVKGSLIDDGNVEVAAVLIDEGNVEGG